LNEGSYHCSTDVIVYLPRTRAVKALGAVYFGFEIADCELRMADGKRRGDGIANCELLVAD